MLIPTIEHVNVRVNLQFRLNVPNSNDSLAQLKNASKH